MHLMQLGLNRFSKADESIEGHHSKQHPEAPKETGSHGKSGSKQHFETHKDTGSHGGTESKQPPEQPRETGPHVGNTWGTESAEHGSEESQSHGESESAEHDSEEHHGPAGDVEVAVGASLMGMIVFIMVVLYTVNSPVENVRQVTNQTISNTISIFVAVLSYSCFETCLEPLFLQSKAIELTVRFTSSVVLLFMVCGLMHMQICQTALNLKAVSIFGSHLVGCAAAEAFGCLQQLPPFGSQLLAAASIAGTALICFFLVHMLLTRAMHVPGNKLLEDETEDFEIETYCFSVAFLLAQAAKMSALGHITPVDGQPKYHTQKEVACLFFWYGISLVCLAGAAVMHDTSSRTGWSKDVHRMFHFLQMLAAMTTAWISLFIGQWLWFLKFPEQTVAFGVMVLAFIGSGVAMAAIHVLDLASLYVAPQSLQALIASIAVAVGLSWEKAFHHATHALASRVPEAPRAFVTMLTLVVAVVVLPAWRLFFLPQAVNEGKNSFLRQEGYAAEG